MPNVQPTLLDIAKNNGSDKTVGLIDESIADSPELTRGAARTIAGISYKTLVLKSVPRGGAFRDANEGVNAVKAEYENRRVETYIMETHFKADKAIADRHEDGPGVFLARNAADVLKGRILDLAQCFYYGNDAATTYVANAKGFPGLLNMYDANTMFVDAGGTTADTGSSVWLVKWGHQALQWVYGNNGTLEMSDPVVALLQDEADSTKEYLGYYQTMLAYPGLALHSQFAICRIKNLTADAGKDLTDKLLYQALDKFKTGWKPDDIFMTRRSRQQWRESRTATNATGAPAPMPDNFENIPVHITEMIRNDESLTW